jgi:ribosomal protein L35AE/L33A
LRRAVSAAAGGAGTEQEFFARLDSAGILVRKRYSTAIPGQVTGYAVGLLHHTGKYGGVIWYGGGKLTADLTLPKLRARWVARAEECLRPGLPPQMAQAVFRARMGDAVQQTRGEADFFSHLRRSGVLVRLRFSETDPGQVTGYAVTLAGHTRDGALRWNGGGRLAAGMTLPQLRRQWSQQRGPPGRPASRFTAAERKLLYRHAGPAGRGRRGTDLAQRGERPDCGRRCGLGGGRSIRCHSGCAARPGAAGRSGRLRPSGSSAVRADPGPYGGR